LGRKALTERQRDQLEREKNAGVNQARRIEMQLRRDWKKNQKKPKNK